MQQVRSSSARVSEVTPAALGLQPAGDRGNQARLEQMGNPRSNIAQQLGMLEHASGAFGELGEEDAAALAGLNERLAAARSGLAEGDLSGLLEEVASLDGAYGNLVADTGTIIEMQALGPSDAEPGTFDNVDTYYTNGMTNSLTQSMRSAQEVADLRGTDVGLVYNATNGFGDDLGQSIGQRIDGAIPFWDHRSTEGGTLANAVSGSLDAGRNVDLVSHSQGGLFGQEALERLGTTDEMRQVLDERVHLNAMGSAIEDDSLPDWFDNATFIDENSDPIARNIGRRMGADEDRSWFDKVFGRGAVNDGMGQLQFESGEVGMEAHRPATYLQNQEVRDHLATNPFSDRGGDGGGSW